MSPEQTAKVLASLEEVEAWAGGLLQRCAQTRKLIEGSGAGLTARSRKPSPLTLEERTEIRGKLRERLLKPKKR